MNDYQESFPRPWDMPMEVYWDITDGATLRRGQWVVDNVPGVTVEQVAQAFVMQPEEVARLDLSSPAAASDKGNKEE